MSADRPLWISFRGVEPESNRVPEARMLELREGLACEPMVATLGLTRELRPLLARIKSPSVRHLFLESDGGENDPFFKSVVLSLCMGRSSRDMKIAVIDGCEGKYLLCGLQSSGMDSLGRIVEFIDETRGEPFPRDGVRTLVIVNNLQRVVSRYGEGMRTILKYVLAYGAERGVHMVVSSADNLEKLLDSEVNFSCLRIYKCQASDGCNHVCIFKGGVVPFVAATVTDPEIFANMPGPHVLPTS